MQVEPLTPAAGSHIYYTYTVDVLPAIILRHFIAVMTALGRKTTISPTD